MLVLPPIPIASPVRPSTAGAKRDPPRAKTKGVGKVDEIFGMPEADKEILLLQLADWDPTIKLKVKPIELLALTNSLSISAC